MSDIFISYAKADRDKAKLLDDVLKQQGWSVWWDRTILPGESFDEVIEEALDLAKCVIVLWSKESVSSRWVKTEAQEGMRRGILVPALIEEVRIPLEFRRLQAADLSNWQGASPHSELDKLVKSVATHLGCSVTTESTDVAKEVEESGSTPSHPKVTPKSKRMEKSRARFCDQCGEMIEEEDSKFCIFCGADLGD